jgi:hypothetical protein
MIQNTIFDRSSSQAAVAAAFICSACAAATAAPPENQDKSQFTLFNPTPLALMRDLSTDRPDTTESPYTLDAGHFQIELSLFEYTRDSRDDAVSVLPANIKFGILNNFDLQFVINPYTRSRSAGVTQSGFGDSEIRAKFNLWGNDGGSTALALMPFVHLPTGTGGQSNHRVEGGLIIPIAFELPSDFSLGAMLEFDAVRNANNDGYGMNIVHTITLSHPLWTENLSGFIEYVGVSPIDLGDTYKAYLDIGITYGMTENIQLDAGFNFGLSGRAEDVTFFLGFTYRQ